MKQLFPQVIGPVIIGMSCVVSTAYADGPEFGQLASTVLVAPLPLVPYGKSYIPLNPPYVFHTNPVTWGNGVNVSRSVIPSIGFGVDDNVGIPANAKCPNLFNSAKVLFPKHLGTDYAAPAGTPVYAIADGTIRRVNGFSGVGDYYIVVESGINQKWTTLYGHLNQPSSYPLFGLGFDNLNIPITKGQQIGTLYNFIADGDQPHLHLGIRNGAYDGTAKSNKGFVCEVDPNTGVLDPIYQNSRYNFVNPQFLSYFTKYY